jgi:hypothetical protein
VLCITHTRKCKQKKASRTETPRLIFFIVFGFEFRIIRLFVDDKLINQKKFIFFPEVDPVLLSLCLLCNGDFQSERALEGFRNRTL